MDKQGLIDKQAALDVVKKHLSPGSKKDSGAEDPDAADAAQRAEAISALKGAVNHTTSLLNAKMGEAKKEVVVTVKQGGSSVVTRSKGQAVVTLCKEDVENMDDEESEDEDEGGEDEDEDEEDHVHAEDMLMIFIMMLKSAMIQ